MIRAYFDSGRAAPARGLRVVLPAVAAALLAGCVTSDYRYREDNGGGYYYGTPSVQYRERSPYPYGPYPYGYGGYGPYGAYGPYGSYRYWHPSPYYGYRDPYYGYYGYYGYPYGGYPYGYPYRHVEPRRRVAPRPDTTPDRPRSPWRDLDNLRRRQPTPPPVAPPATQGIQPRSPAVLPAPTRSGTGERIRRAKERASGREETF